MKLKTPEEYKYIVKNNLCLFQVGPLSQWFGGYKGQDASFKPVGAAFGKTPVEEFNTCEQWMMACKAAIMNDQETADKILAEKNPPKQKDLGREVKNFDAKLWDAHKENVVYYGNLWKFQQNPHMLEFLKQFPIDTIFAEAAPWDKVWGIGLGPDSVDALNPEKWLGLNLLGKAISRVRKELE
jgi:ribA/ribD-fused uncharacterized protein